jgi:hypothetical protein
MPGGALVDFAEDLGKILGTAERKAATWLDQRKVVADQLSTIRDKASALLRQLGSLELPLAGRAGAAGGRKKGRAPGRPAKRQFSAETRAKMAAAARRRWAAKRKAAKKGAGGGNT